MKAIQRKYSVVYDKAEKALSGQRHHSSADDKTIESWKLNHSWLIVLQTDTGIRLKCPVCFEAKVSSIWAQEGSCNYRKTVLPVILKAVNTAKMNFHVYNRKYVQSLHQTAKLKNLMIINKPRKKEDIKRFRTVFCLASHLI